MKETFEYRITADDYLIHQLFEVSRNAVVKNQRKRGLILWTSVFFIMALAFFWQGNKYLGLYFILFGIGFIFIYPFYSRWIYKRYYSRYISKMLKNRNSENMNLCFEAEEIVLSNEDNEGRIPNEDIEGVFEISTHIFLKLEGGRNIIIPKLKINNFEVLQNIVVLLAEKYNVEYNKLPGWKW